MIVASCFSRHFSLSGLIAALNRKADVLTATTAEAL
jgi:hypothetical protein